MVHVSNAFGTECVHRSSATTMGRWIFVFSQATVGPWEHEGADEQAVVMRCYNTQKKTVPLRSLKT